MKKFEVSFKDIFIECDSEEDAYEQLLCYLHEVVRNEDVTAFNFKEVV